MKKQILNVYLENENSHIEVIDSGHYVKTINNIIYGKNGHVNCENKEEGDHKTPLGEFYLGFAFGTISSETFNYPYVKISDNSYWVDDINSIYYNKWVEIGDLPIMVDFPYVCNTEDLKWASSEKLSDYSELYKKAIVIEYNISDDLDFGNAKGSAIFLHLKSKNSYTGGCIAIDESDMDWLLKWLDYSKKPIINIQITKG